MNRIDSLIQLVGFILLFVFLTVWVQKILSKIRTDRIPSREWLIMFGLNVMIHVSLTAYIQGWVEYETFFPLLGRAGVGFFLYAVFASVFLNDRSPSVRFLFLGLLSGILFPLQKFWIGSADAWGAGTVYLSLGVLAWIGVVFLPLTWISLASGIKDFSLQTWGGLVFGLVSLGLMDLGVFQGSESDFQRALWGMVWCLFVGGVTSWAVYHLAGRTEWEDFYIFTGMVAGTAVHSGLPLHWNLWLFTGLASLAGLVPALAFPLLSRVGKSCVAAVLLGGFGWGGILGVFVAYNRVDSGDMASAIRAFRDGSLFWNGLQTQGWLVLKVIASTGLVAWMGVGMAILLDRIQGRDKPQPDQLTN